MSETVNGPADGGKYIDQIDPEDPEYVRQMQRPAEVKEDMRQMEDRSRVTRIMKSQAFKEELEQMIDEQIRSGPHPASLLALQQISELILPQGKPGPASAASAAGVSGAVIPVADIRGVDSLNYTKGEKVMRNKTATLYRLVDLYGGSHGFNGLISARLSQDFEHFLVAPYGLLFSELTASSLLKVDMGGQVLDPGTTPHRLNRAGFSLNSAIHAARPDLKTLIHIQTPSTVSVSVQNCGLLPLCPEAMVLGDISYYAYSGALADQEEKDKLTRALGPNNRVMFLRSYGVIVGGTSIEDAYIQSYNVLTAVETQLRTIHVGLDNIAMPTEEVRKKAQDLANQSWGADGDSKKGWRRGELEFEAIARQLDNAGFRTGVVYREAGSRRQDRRERANSEVEIPPSATSAGAYYEDDFRSPLKTHMEKQKKTYRTEWLNSPNAYKKEEIDEIGTPNPKKITKWVKEEGDGNSPTVRVDKPNQFAPQGDNPKELKQKYKEIRKEYYEDHIDAGPQSRILEGITYDEAKRIQDGHVSGTSDTMIVVGAASKGIIQRDHQHNAVVYKTTYAPNPFDNMTEDEITKYKADIQKRGQSGAESALSGDEGVQPGPDGHLISTEERMQQVRQGPGETTVVTTTTVVTKQRQDSEEPQYLETSLDDLNDTGVRETDIDAPYSDSTVRRSSGGRRAERSSPKTSKDTPARRTQSERLPAKKSKALVKELQQSLDKRSKDAKKNKDTAINGDEGAVLSSPTKSYSSAEGTMDETERSSREGSPSKTATSAASESESPEKGGGDKKKKKFRMPSFSSKKKEKEKKK